MLGAVTAGTLYFAVVFAAAFGLGIVRSLLIAPAIGEVPAVLVEVPIILTVAWFACGWALRRSNPSLGRSCGAVMGITAFVLLLLAEVCVSLMLMGRTLAEHLETYRAPSALIGLAAQVLYASFPLMRRP